MSDNLQGTPGTGLTIRSHQIASGANAGAQLQHVVLVDDTDAAVALATAAKQPALGTAGTPSADVISVQGAPSMTALKVDGSATTQPVSGTVAISGTVPVSAASLPLPTGASTAAKQPALGTAGTPSADVISVQGAPSMTALKVDGSATTQPVSAAALPLPAGAATAAKQPALGTAGAASADVITVQGNASGTPIPVSVGSIALPTGASTAAKQPALGTAGTPSADVISVQGAPSMTALKVDGSATTQPVSGTVAISGTVPVSAAALPLPSGASTAAKQPALGTAGTPSADVISVQGAPSMTALKVDGSATTQPVSAASLPLPTGAATSALQSTMSTTLSTIATNTTPGTSGPLAAASSKSMTVATDDAFLGPSIASALFGPQSATGDIVAEVDVSNYAGAYVDISGITTATLQFFGGNFTGALKTLGTCQPTDTPTISPPVSSVTSNKMLWVPFGFKYFRVNVSAWTSGAISVRIQYVLKGTPVPFTQVTQITPAPTVTVGPATFFRGQNAVNSNSATNIKATAAILTNLTLTNQDASLFLYVQLYNKGSTPVPGTDTPNQTYLVPPKTSIAVDCGAFGIRFSNGLGIAASTDFAGSGSPTIAAADLTWTGAYA